MDTLEAYYCKLAQMLIVKHNPTKLELLKFVSNERDDPLLLSSPYPLTEEQKNICIKFDAEKEYIDFHVYKWIISLTFPEFSMNITFIETLLHLHYFWQLNLKYYEYKGKTIFEVYPLPDFDFASWDFWYKLYFEKNEQLGLSHEEILFEIKKELEMQNVYINQIIEIATNAITDL